MNPKFTIDDLKEMQKRFELYGFDNKPITIITEDVEIYNACKEYSDIKIYHLDGTDWREEK